VKNTMLAKIAIVMVMMVLLTGCGKAEETVAEAPAAEQQAESASAEADDTAAMTVADIYQKIAESVELYSPFCWDDEFISNYYDIDVTALEEYVFSMSEDATSAETIIIMKAKSAETVEELKSCLQVVVDEKKNEMENYLPEQFAIVEKSAVQVKGQYVWLVISENAGTITEIIEAGI